MSKTILFNNATAIPVLAATTPAVSLQNAIDADAGKIYVFDADNMDGDALALDAAAGVERVIFIQSGEGDDYVQSPVIEVSKVKFNSKLYEAPVNQVTTVTVPGSLDNEIVTIQLTSADHGYRPDKSFTFSRHVSGTATEVAAAIVAELNSKRNTFYVASNSAGVISITGKDAVSFSTGLGDAAKDWARSVATEPKQGSGTFEQVKEMEDEAYGTLFTNRIYLPITPNGYATKGVSYDLHTLRLPTNTTPNISVANTEFEVRLAVNTEVAEAEIDLATFFG